LPTAILHLTRDGDGWVIAFSERRFGPFASVDDAASVAISVAEKALAKGRSAEVRVLAGDADFPLWRDGIILS
jgi:hypothetical protein